MLHIAAGVAIAAWIMLVASLFDPDVWTRPQPKPCWRRPYIQRLPTPVEERIIGTTLAVCTTLTGGFVLFVVALAWFVNA